MFRFLMLTLIISSHFATAQNDSLLKPFKHILYSQVGAAPFQTESDTGNSDNVFRSYSNTFSVNAGYEFLIPDKKFKRNHYYFGLNLIFNQNRFKLYLVDHYDENYGHFQPYHSFSQGEFNIRYYALGIAPAVSQYTYFKKFLVFQKLGLSINKSLSKKEFNYTETVRSSSPAKDSVYITPENPDGWYWPRNNYTIEHSETTGDYFSINPYYQFGLAYKINRFAISCNVQATTIRKIVNGPTFSGQFGIIYGFK